MIDFLDFILENTACQRYLLVRLFLDRPFAKFTPLPLESLRVALKSTLTLLQVSR